MSRRAEIAFRSFDRSVETETPERCDGMERCSTISLMTLLFELSQYSNLSIVRETSSVEGDPQRGAARC